MGNATVVDGNRNRSPSAYLANPADERALYEYDQDKDLSLLKFDDADGNARGFLSFFAVHGTSLYEVSSRMPVHLMKLITGLRRITRSLVGITREWLPIFMRVGGSSNVHEHTLTDLSYLAMEQPDVMPGNNTFVAGFTQC